MNNVYDEALASETGDVETSPVLVWLRTKTNKSPIHIPVESTLSVEMIPLQRSEYLPYSLKLRANTIIDSIFLFSRLPLNSIGREMPRINAKRMESSTLIRTN